MLGVARTSFAQSDSDRAAARRIATAGVEAYEQQDFRLAAEKLQRAYDMLKAPSVALWLARALSQQGQLVAAAERYADAGRLPADARGDAAVQAAAKRDAAAELEALTPQIPLLVIQVSGAPTSELSFSLDGRALSSAVVGEQQPVDPGKHHLEARWGERVVSTDVQLGRGETKVASLRFDQPSDAAGNSSDRPHAPAPDLGTEAGAGDAPRASEASVDASTAAGRNGSLRVLGYSLGAAGVAGIGVGGLFGYLALQAKGDQTESCESSRNCPDHAGASAAHQSAVTRGTVATIAFVGGAALTTVGLVLLITNKRAAQEAPVASVALCTSVGPATAGVRLVGEF